MTDKQRADVAQAMLGRINASTGNKLLDRIATEIEKVIAEDVLLIEPVVDAMIQAERAERFRMLLEICAVNRVATVEKV
jgi:hypothetical protein